MPRNPSPRRARPGARCRDRAAIHGRVVVPGSCRSDRPCREPRDVLRHGPEGRGSARPRRLDVSWRRRVQGGQIPSAPLPGRPRAEGAAVVRPGDRHDPDRRTARAVREPDREVDRESRDQPQSPQGRPARRPGPAWRDLRRGPRRPEGPSRDAVRGRGVVPRGGRQARHQVRDGLLLAAPARSHASEEAQPFDPSVGRRAQATCPACRRAVRPSQDASGRRGQASHLHIEGPCQLAGRARVASEGWLTRSRTEAIRLRYERERRDVIAQVWALRADGLSTAEIARRVGRCADTVRGIINQDRPRAGRKAA